MSKFLGWVIHWFWKSICEVKKIFGDSDCAQQFILTLHVLTIELIHEKLLPHTDNSRHLQDLLTCWPELCLNLYKLLCDISQITRKVVWNLWVNTPEYLLVQALHIICPEWRLQSNRLVKHTPKRPDITLHIIWLVSPHLWTCIVWRTSLGIEKPLLSYFRYIHVTKLGWTIFIEEHISTF